MEKWLYKGCVLYILGKYKVLITLSEVSPEILGPYSHF